MTWSIKNVEKSHPALFHACKLIADDSGLPAEHWEVDVRFQLELSELERQAQLLTELPASEDWEHDREATALNDFAAGEFTHHCRLGEAHGLGRLSWFLNHFFGECEYVLPGEETVPWPLNAH